MATRLDRLFLLLETGSTPVIRKSAAEQLGQVQKLHPHELCNLLAKVHPYLGSESWDTRIAAAQAVEAIIKHVQQWTPQLSTQSTYKYKNLTGLLRLSQFNIGTVMKNAASLLASEGTEFDVEEDISLDQKEKLAHQRQLLNRRLGLDQTSHLGIGGEELFAEEDLVVKRENQPSQNHSSVQELLQQQIEGRGSPDPSGLSNRELNRAKRKAKFLAKQVSKEDQKNGDSDGEPSSKMRKTSSVLVNQPSQDKVLMDSVPDNILNLDQLEEWPFTGFCEILMNEIFNSSWEKRHGAAMGLKEVVRLHGNTAGMLSSDKNEQSYENSLWLEDLSVRLICVMALDRFGDFVADEVVAPVRESCAQALGMCLHHMSQESVLLVSRTLVQLLGQQQWEVRHGGLLGIKYMLAVQANSRDTLLPDLLPAIYNGLQDMNDDVRAVAAASLLPATQTLVTSLSNHLSSIIQCLWYSLLDLDDLTASTNSIMSLLSTLLASPGYADDSFGGQSLTILVPRLWPFLHHNISSVRKSCLQTLVTLLRHCKTQGEAAMWMVPILQDCLRLLFQRSLLEVKENIIPVILEVWDLVLECSPINDLLMASCPWIGVWLCLLMQPASMAFDPSLLIQIKHAPKEMTPSRARLQSLTGMHSSPDPVVSKEYIGGNASDANKDVVVIRARFLASNLLGKLCRYLARTPPQFVQSGAEHPMEALSRLISFHLSSKSALQRLGVALVLYNWAHESRPEELANCPPLIRTHLLECLTSNIYFDEIALSFTRMQSECQNFVASLKQAGADMDSLVQPGIIYTLDQANALCSTAYPAVREQVKIKQVSTFDDRCKALQQTVTETSTEHQSHSVRVQSSLASSAIWLSVMPEKMNPVVRPLMECLRKEPNLQMQNLAANALSHLLRLLVCSDRESNPTPKVIKNLCSMMCSDEDFTPSVNNPPCGNITEAEITCDMYSGILQLHAQPVTVETTGRGRRPAATKKAICTGIEISMETIQGQDDTAKKQVLMSRRGATLALSCVAKDSGAQLVTEMSYLWEAMTGKFLKSHANAASEISPEDAQEYVNSLQVLQLVGPELHPTLLNEVISNLPLLSSLLFNQYTSVRHMAARCLAMLCRLRRSAVMNHVLEDIVPAMGASDNVVRRQGGVECLSFILEELGVDVVPYAVLLVVPVLGRMSDQNQAVRLMATQCFATLIRLMPLETGIPDPPDLSAQLVQQKERERRFLEQLLDGSTVDDYQVPVPIKADLRKYQQDGVNWLSFLNRYHLHGILCDDMGLGKTLMSLCILAGDHYLRAKAFEKTQQPNSAPLPSIVICPPTLTGHWVYEVEKFVSAEHLYPLHYTGCPAERVRLQKTIGRYNLVVASYDVVRNDIDFFGTINWNYCILDEGHIIKNSKTKLSKAVKQLNCNHRLILSGTPIQNNVLELWSLFDFLMPGFLGTERQFQARYGRPILLSRDAKSSSKEQEAGARAMEALHRQVLPFLLRRLKENVLQDLPPKIIQDYYCELSPLQVQLYEDFAKSRARQNAEDSARDVSESKETVKPTSHIFQALQYLKKLCNHPALVLNANHPQFAAVTSQLRLQKSELRDISHAPKLSALKQLLNDCGIGISSSESSDAPVVNQHRALVFCQLKSMLDIVEKDLLKKFMPEVSFMRLDGSVPAGDRHGIVNRFNNDPSIDILLLTTHVGGLGLNLTGADTVIFVEHDWNPMKDLQAMDRAHRIGQKKVVNVYRLITKNTLEEKIMGLQKFKLNIANSVISQENSSLASMGTDQLLDLFSLDAKSEPCTSADNPSGKGLKGVLEGIQELWDEKQYEDEYDLSRFIQSLNKH